MTEFIDRNTFYHLVSLAAIEIDESEGEYLRQELNHQIRAVQELAAIPMDDETPPASHGITYTPQNSQAFREDLWEAFEKPEEILSQAPQTQDGYIVVPDIPHETLE